MSSTLLIMQSILALCSREEAPVRSGADRLDQYLRVIEEKNFALVANHTSVVGDSHLVDTLLSSGITRDQLLKVFAPEHGFRGGMAAGHQVEDGTDPVTGISIVSLYGKNRKPTSEML